jgi:dTDP-L-rhamnose 4-epimerase
MTILVTGGAGFVGSHVVDALVEAGLRVRVIDCLHPAAHRRMPPYLNPEAEHVQGDLRDEDMVARLLGGVDAVCHQASMVGLGSDFDDVRAYVDHNDGGTASLLRCLHRRRFEGRLVLASSMVVYGEGRYRCLEHGEVRPSSRDAGDLAAGRFEHRCPTCGAELIPVPVGEDSPLDPRNVYAATKLHQEHLCQAFARATAAPVVALRYHNVYGPRMPRDTPYAGVSSIFRSALEAGRAPEVFEDGRQLRDFVHVADVARANLLSLLAPQPLCGAVNVASGEPHTVGEMAEALAAAFGGAIRPQVSGRFRLGDVRHVFASTARAERELGFRASVPFSVGMSALARAHLRS